MHYESTRLIAFYLGCVAGVSFTRSNY